MLVFSMNHLRLTDLEPKLVWEELSYSKLYLENLLGKKVSMLSYPYGKYNEIVKIT